MKTVSLVDFRVDLTKHLASAVNGEPVAVMRYGKREAALIPIHEKRVPALIKALEAMREAQRHALSAPGVADLSSHLASTLAGHALPVLDAYEEFREDLWSIVLGKEAPK